MNTYSLPKPVETTLYDKDGNRWDSQGRYWTSDYAKNNYFFSIINTNHPSVGVGAPSIKSARKIWGRS